MAPMTPFVLHKDSHRFLSVLSSALSEWVLMFLLFLDGLFSYFVIKFARFRKLQTPCLICSRLDHILGNEKPGFYLDLICNAHKSEIASVSYCDVRQKLADAHDMRQDCSISLATDKNVNPRTYRPFVGLEMNLDDSVDAYPVFPASVNGHVQHISNKEDMAKVPVVNKDLELDSPSTRICSFCSKSFTAISDDLRLSRSNLVDVAEVGQSTSGSADQSPKKFHDASSLATESSLVLPVISPENNGFHPLSHNGYSGSQVVPDPVSEIPVSHGNNGTMFHGTRDLKGEFMDQSLQTEPVFTPQSLSRNPSDDIERLIHNDPTKLHHFPLSIPEEQILQDDFHDVSHMTSRISIEHDPEEVNCHEAESLHGPSSTSKIITPQVSLENPNKQRTFSTSEDVSLALGSFGANMKSVQIRADFSRPSLNVPMDLNDAYRLVISSKSTLPSPSFTEVVTGSGSSRVHEDLKSLIRQLSSSSRIDSPWIDVIPSPRVSYPSDEYKYSDASSSTILHNITKRLSIDRNESGFESLDGSVVSEIEGESVTDRLKRQVELDRKSINLLYKELEEERNASAISATQAMAMITRLQQEKAAMQMEAFQYQRLMEDQAEYDQEAVQKSNELLAEREKELHDMQSELETYRSRYIER